MTRPALAPGITIDGFTLVERAHLGRATEIWRVARTDLDAPALMKLPRRDMPPGPAHLIGFEVEQMILAELTGRHVPAVIATGDFAIEPYIVMEEIRGTTLAALLSDTALPLPVLTSLGLAMIEAVADIHRQGVLHLAIEPRAVIFRPTGEAALVDFARARHAELPDLLGEQTRQAVGAPAFMAPEQTLRIRSDRRSDIYALGGILYRMATGRLPFGNPTRTAEVKRRVWRDPAPPRALVPDLPPALQEVILRCLEVDPRRRYGSAEDLALDLRHLDLVETSKRAAATGGQGLGDRWVRWLGSSATLDEIKTAAAVSRAPQPVILVGVETRPAYEDERLALLDATASLLANTPGARLACAEAGPPPAGSDRGPEGEATAARARRMAALKAWAEPLALPRAKVTYHLIDAASRADGLLALARTRKAGHLIVAPSLAGETEDAAALVEAMLVRAPCPVTVAR